MNLYCPYCATEITPENIQCPSCGIPYEVEALLLIRNFVRQAMAWHALERENLFAQELEAH